MAGLDLESGLVRQPLQLDLPQMHARAVAAATVGGDRQRPGIREALLAEVLPPGADAPTEN